MQNYSPQPPPPSFSSHASTQTPFFNGKIRKICTTQTRMLHYEICSIELLYQWVVEVTAPHTIVHLTLCGHPSCTTFLSHMSAHALASLFIIYTHATSAAYNGQKHLQLLSLPTHTPYICSCKEPKRIFGCGELLDHHPTHDSNTHI